MHCKKESERILHQAIQKQALKEGLEWLLKNECEDQKVKSIKAGMAAPLYPLKPAPKTPGGICRSRTIGAETVSRCHGRGQAQRRVCCVRHRRTLVARTNTRYAAVAGRTPAWTGSSLAADCLGVHDGESHAVSPARPVESFSFLTMIHSFDLLDASVSVLGRRLETAWSLQEKH